MTKIEWTDRTWNPTTGCNKVSQGCKNCYAQKQHARLQHMHPGKYTKGFTEGVQLHADVLRAPLTWKKPARVFVNSMSDLFHADVPFEFILRVFSIMALTPRHTYQILTKRPERMKEFFDIINNPAHHRNAKEKLQINAHPYLLEWNSFEWPLPNVWLGTSVENQEEACKRIPFLIKVPAAVRFLSCEPLLGPLDLTFLRQTSVSGIDALSNHPIGSPDKPFIDWVIAGGESGPGARPMHPDWVRSLRDQCAGANVPFFFKQWGHYRPAIFQSEGVGYRHKLFLTIEGAARLTSSLITDKEVLMLKIGKSKSGNLLDGKQYLNFPNPIKSTV